MTDLLPNSPKAAKKIGSKFYFTGKPCKNNHIANRYTLSRVCVKCKIGQDIFNKEKNNTKARERYKNNPEKYRTEATKYRKNNPRKAAEYYKNNHEKELIRCARYRKNNKEKNKIRCANYQKNNPEQCRIKTARYRKNNPGKALRTPCGSVPDIPESRVSLHQAKHHHRRGIHGSNT